MEEMGMAFSVRDPILAIVDDRASYLEYLIQEYPHILKQWEKKVDCEFEKEAELCSDGDIEVRESMLLQLRRAFDDSEARKNIFYKAILLMVYSYYDGLVSHLTKGTSSREKVKAFCRSKNIKLSDEAKMAIQSIDNETRVLRNQIAHNNVNKPKRIIDIMGICAKWNGLTYCEDSDGFVFTEPDFIIDSLRNELLVLRELCYRTGHRNRTIG